MQQWKQCEHDFSKLKQTKYIGEIRQYKVRTSPVILYYCETITSDLSCYESFFTRRDKTRKTYFKKVSRRECIVAVKTKISIYGKLRKTSYHTWQSKPDTTYNCVWLKQTDSQYNVFKLHRIKAYITGDDKEITQGFTNTKCIFKKNYCIPREQEKGILVWNTTVHNPHIYRSLGIKEVDQLGDFILISSLGISGSIIKKDQNLFLLDNTYVIEIIFII